MNSAITARLVSYNDHYVNLTNLVVYRCDVCSMSDNLVINGDFQPKVTRQHLIEGGGRIYSLSPYNIDQKFTKDSVITTISQTLTRL